jgi:hypothetical protein
MDEAFPTADSLYISAEEFILNEEIATTQRYIQYVCKQLKDRILMESDRTKWYVVCAKTIKDCETYWSLKRFVNVERFYKHSIITPYSMDYYSIKRYSETYFVEHLLDAGYQVHTETLCPVFDWCNEDTWCRRTPINVYIIKLN